MEADVLVVGAGGAGYPAAFRLAEAGRRVVMADPKGELGGNCLFSGCIPSKTLRELCQVAVRARRLLAWAGPVDFGDLQRQRDEVQQVRFRQHQDELGAHPAVTFLKGTVELLGKGRARVHGPEGSTDVTAPGMILGTGTRVKRPDFPGAELCLTSDDLFRFQAPRIRLPADLVVIGGGYIALEVASLFSALGSKVRVLVRSDTLLRNVDPELVALLQGALHDFIIEFHAPVSRVEAVGDRRRVIYGEGAQARMAEADAVVVAAGREPVLPEGWERTGIALDRRGFVVTDEAVMTSVPGIYAPGDVNGRAPYFHAAVRESLVAAHNLLAGNSRVDVMDYGSVPVTIFTFPSLAYVGVTASEARRRGIPTVVAHASLSEDSRAQMVREREGEVRLFFQPGSLRLLGAWVLGISASELINELGLAVSAGLTARDLADFPDQHPTTNEAISKAARSLL
jgi:dihydrolipoamide dehydrogenase